MKIFLVPITLFRVSSSLFSFLHGDYVDKARELCSATASEVFCQALFLIFIFNFGVVGTTIGAIAGALIGVKHKMRFLHDVIVGAIYGAVLSHKVTKATFDHFLHSDDGDELKCIQHLIEIFARHMEGRLIQDIDRLNNPVVINQVAAINESSKWVPKIKITNHNILDTSGNTISCSICLQDFEVGNVVESLPQCRHMFHPHCISKWLIRHSSCPLCRRSRPRKTKKH